jgi:2-iminobutanoate/2-iminopropanoate deaminase
MAITHLNPARCTAIQDVNEGFAASRKAWGDQPTAVTVQFVRALGRPEFLVEIDAIAALPG